MVTLLNPHDSVLYYNLPYKVNYGELENDLRIASILIKVYGFESQLSVLVYILVH